MCVTYNWGNTSNAIYQAEDSTISAAIQDRQLELEEKQRRGVWSSVNVYFLLFIYLYEITWELIKILQKGLHISCIYV